MKLRNKLIPIMTAATVAATVAPISSCAIGQTVVNLINGYTPSIKKAVGEDYLANKDDMLSFYASAVNENPDILVQDLYGRYCVEQHYSLDVGQYDYFVSDYIGGTPVIVSGPSYHEQLGDVLSLDKFDALVNNVKVNKLTCLYDDEETKERKEINYYTMSFDAAISMSYTLNETDIDVYFYEDTYEVEHESVGVGKGEYNINTNVSVKNVPFTINREGSKVYHDGTAVVDYDPSFNFKYSFKEGHLPTSGVIQPIVSMTYDTVSKPGPIAKGFNHEAFTRLEDNGYEGYIKANFQSSNTYTEYATNVPKTEVINRNIEFVEDEQGEKANQYYIVSEERSKVGLEGYLARTIYNGYLPSYYLSDIEDINEQLGGLN